MTFDVVNHGRHEDMKTRVIKLGPFLGGMKQQNVCLREFP